MQIEPMPKRDGWRCWLSDNEEDLLVEYYSEEPRKQLAIELILDGLRSKETTQVSKEDFRRLDTETEAWCLRVWESKTGYRECPVSAEMKQRAVMLANTRGLRKDEPLIDVTPRSIQRWVTNAVSGLAEQTGNDDWEKVSAHDLRRTWATTVYYRLVSSGGSNDVKEVIMRWGGWDDGDVFENNYLGRVPDDLAADLMQKAGFA